MSPPRSRRWLYLLPPLVLIVAGVAVGSWLAARAFGPMLARERVESALAAALERPVTVEAVRLEPWLGRVVITGVSVAAREGSAAGTMLELGRAEARLGISSLWRREVVLSRFLLEDLDLRVTAEGGGPAGPVLLPERIALGPVDLRIRKIELRRGRIDYVDPAARRRLRVEGAHAVARPGPDAMDLTVRAEAIELGTPELQERFERVDGDARIAPDRVALRRLSLDWHGREVELAGEVRQPFTDPALQLTVRGELELAPLAARAGVAWRIAGRARSEATVDGPLEALRVALRVAVPALEAGPISARQVGLTATWAEGRLDIERLSALVLGGELAGSFHLEPRSLERSRATVRLRNIPLPELERLLAPGTLGLQGRVDLDGQLAGHPGRLRETRGALTLSARAVELPGSLVRPGASPLRAPEVAARASWGDGALEVSELRARVLEGALTGSLGVRLERPYRSRVRLELRDISLAGLDGLAGTSAGVRGRLDLDGEATGDFSRVVEGRGRVRVEARQVELPGALAPLGAGTVAGEATFGERTIDLAAARAQWPGARVDADGRAGLEGPSPLRLRLTVGLDTLARILGRPMPAGEASLRAEVRGGWTSPEVEGRLEAPTVEIRGAMLERLDLPFRFAGRTLEVRGASLGLGQSQLAASGSATVAGTGSLLGGIEPRDLQFRLALDAPRLRLEDLAAVLPPAWRGSGQLTASSRLEGSPVDWKASGVLESRALLAPAGLRVRDLRATVSAHPDRVQVRSLTATVEDAPLTARGTWAWAGTGQATAEVGPVLLAALPAIPTGLGLGGSARATLEASVAAGDIAARATVTIEGASVRGVGLGGGSGEAILRGSDLEARLDFPERRASASARGRLASDGSIDARVAVAKLELEPLLRQLWPGRPAGLGGSVSAVAALTIPLSAPSRAVGALRLEPAALEIAEELWRARGPIVVKREPGRLRLQPFELVGPPGTVRGSGVLDDGGGLEGEVRGSFPLAVLARMRPEISEAGGILEIDARVTGSAAAPRFAGEGTVSGGRLALRDYPAVLRHIRAHFMLAPEGLHLTGARAELGQGSLLVTGDVGFAGRAVGLYHLQVTGRDLPAAPLPGLETSWNADLEVLGRPSHTLVRGEVKLLRGRYSRDLRLVPLLLARPVGPEAPGAGATVRLDVLVDLQDRLVVRTPLAQFRAGGTVTLQGSLAGPMLFGTLEAREGSLSFRRHRFALESAAARFTDPRRIDPVLDVRGTARIRQYDVTLGLQGRAEDLTIRLSSVPPLPQEDLLTLVTLGVTREELGRSGGTVVAGEAARLLAEELLGLEGGGGLLDLLEVESSGPEQGTLTAGKRLGERTTVIYSGNLADGREQRLRVEYQLLGPVLLSGEQDFRGGYAADVVLRLRFR